MTKLHISIIAALTLALASGCSPMTDSPSNCFLGPCGTFPAADFTVQVVGFPASRVSDNSGHLVPGDTVRLVVLKVKPQQTACESTDTVRTLITWGVSDGSKATILPHGDGSARLTAEAAGKFSIIMSYSGAGAAYTYQPTSIIACGTGGGILSDIVVGS